MSASWSARLRDLRALLWPLLGYWGILGVGMALFSALILVFESPSPENLLVLGALAVGTSFGVLFGQASALTRLRLPIVLFAGTCVSVLTFAAMSMSLVSALSPLAALFGVIWFLFPFFAVSGLLSLRTSSFQVFSLFAPIVWIVGSILEIADETGSTSEWMAGNKWAIWNLFTAPVLLLGVGLLLLYLASRERYRLHHWLTGSGGPEHPTVTRLRGSALGATASGCGTLASLAVLALLLTVGTGLLAPYLWRTGPADGEPKEQTKHPGKPTHDRDGDGVPDQKEAEDGTDPDNPDSDGDGLTDGQEKRKGTDANNPDTDGDGVRDGDERGNGTSPTNPDTDGDGVGDAQDPGDRIDGQRVVKVVKSVGISLFFLFLLVFLALLGLFVFGPPLRRSLLLAALRRPPFRQTPSHRVAHAWRITEVALGDLGVESQPGDTASALVRRSLPRLPKGLNTEPLVQSAEIADRVRYGLGLDPQDEMRARRNAEMAYQAVWDTLTEWQKVRAVYRWSL